MGEEKKEQNLLTKEGYEKIKEQIEYRENVVREELAETLNEMRNQGDLSENDGYTLAVEENQQNESEIMRLKELLRNAKIVKAVKKDKVGVGNKVTVSFNGKDERVYTIVGEDNVSPLENRISYKSPIGSALLGKKVGDSFELETAKGSLKYKVKSIE